jgi:hypothetical protein
MTATHYLRRVIKVTALDSPNVRREMMRRRGLSPEAWPDEVPGVLSVQEYEHRLAAWDEAKRAVGLDAEFYEGKGVRLYPPDWLDRAARLAASRSRNPKALRAVGVDTGEGVAETSMACVDEGGLLELQSRKTPDTSVIRGEVLAFARKWDVPAERVAFDRGGGGKQIADELRRDGFNVRTVAFGEAVVPEPRRSMATTEQRMSEREERYAYANRRAQMYGELRLLLDPSGPGFAIPAEYAELRRQLAPIPLTYDREGRLELLPKNARGDGERPSLVALIGCSPDQADALVLAVHALRHKSTRARAGAT